MNTKFAWPRDVVQAEAGPDIKLEGGWRILWPFNSFHTVQNDPAVEFIFSQLISVHVTNILVKAPPQGVIKGVMLFFSASFKL